MLTFFLFFLLFIVLFTLAIRTGLAFMGRLAGRHVRRQHEAAEYIINTGKVPDEWFGKMGTGGGWQRAGTTAATHARVLQRLAKLILYFERSSLVDGEPARQLLLDELQRVRRFWQESQREQMHAGQPLRS